MRELKKWSVETVNAKDEKEIEFIITEEDLAYVHSDLTQRADVGEFKLYHEVRQSISDVYRKYSFN